MELYKYFPTPSDRMGTLWTLTSIEDVYIIEFGPAGTTHFAIEGTMGLNGEHNANVFTTHINETDISFGDQERLEKAIEEIDAGHNPKYIFIMASSISAIIGTDIESVCFEMQPKINAKLIPVTTGGFSGDYALGVENTMHLLCKEIVQETEVKKLRSYNIIGNNIDSYNFLSDVEEIKSIMKEAFGFESNTIFTAYTSVDDIENTACSEFNLVLRGEGIKAADYLEKEHNLPYYYGKPYGLEGTMEWINQIKEKFQLKLDQQYIGKQMTLLRKYLMNYKFMTRALDNKKVVLVGDYDIVVGLASLVEELGLEVEKIIVKHKMCKKIKDLIPPRYATRIDFDKSEAEIEEYLSETPVYLILADGSTLELANQSEISLQIGNPNIVKRNIYPYTPFVGFKGLLFMIQNLIELENKKGIA
ncbi:nitrogenase molybdenum-iron protein alpha/beta subunit [Natranaerovirga pectinivora]|uniref:Nitrogenase molybdenum-iron protein alpha/beta subunit n=1 Tax=Natranaerovirga pectinivora TaxID=682400 RepID=A0A4R3MRK9_9FIRM|nr:nitrogenase component 1 [Natranaerovirga pectinivora]TCT15417.1 nitrogenase molybdenum-iron protein alpha/beta subunit [Natranaerovirga pectinivora]